MNLPQFNNNVNFIETQTCAQQKSKVEKFITYTLETTKINLLDGK